ncbi:hypothetical protein JXC34_01575, partial [Candidatus Woesearchaeota archaeon]|nr:hypothetical protein [Candidatus Woesearchaeota archaeon]
GIRMEIFENEDILDVESQYLSERTKQELFMLFDYIRHEERDYVYVAVDRVAGSLPNAEYGSILEALIRNVSSDRGGEFAVFFCSGELQDAYERTLKQFQDGFSVEGVYFWDEGFLGFVFQEGNALMLQISDSSRADDPNYAKTTPFFRIGGRWKGFEYYGPGGIVRGNFSPALIGSEFARYLDGKN